MTDAAKDKEPEKIDINSESLTEICSRLCSVLDERDALTGEIGALRYSLDRHKEQRDRAEEMNKKLTGFILGKDNEIVALTARVAELSAQLSETKVLVEKYGAITETSVGLTSIMETRIEALRSAGKKLRETLEKIASNQIGHQEGLYCPRIARIALSETSALFSGDCCNRNSFQENHAPGCKELKP